MSSLTSETSACLSPIAGPAMEMIALVAAKPLVIGRQERSDIRLNADSVSRSHARIHCVNGTWRLADLKSRWGTSVNGVRLGAGAETSLADGDLICIEPWTFRFVVGRAGPLGMLDRAPGAAFDHADASHTVQRLTLDKLPTLSDLLLNLLLESASAIHAATDERALADVLLSYACRGTGLPNAAILRPLGDRGATRFQTIAVRSPGDATQLTFSRSLLNAAAEGHLAELSTDRQTVDPSISIVNLGVRSALCAPIFLGSTVAAVLYLDARSPAGAGKAQLPLIPNAAAFCSALAKMAGLALANLKRVDMERRMAELQADLIAASAVQQWILPKRQGNVGAFAYYGQSRPGAYVGGDLYELIPLDHNRLAIAIGDVSGHGVAASVLMTTAAGFLHAALAEAADPLAVTRRLNAFIAERCPGDKFMTLWIGILDLEHRRLTYVDAGHGYAILDPGAAPALLQGEPDIPVGIDGEFAFQVRTVPLPEKGRRLLLSDGIIEQTNGPDADHEAQQFGVTNVEAICREKAALNELIDGLFEAVQRHAGQVDLADDATAIAVTWG